MLLNRELISKTRNQAVSSSGYTAASTIYTLVFLASWFVYLVWTIEAIGSPTSSEFERLISPWVLYFFCIIQIGFVCVLKVGPTDLSFWFSTLSFLFMFGHVLISYFGLDLTLVWNPAGVLSNHDKYLATIYSLHCIISLCAARFLFDRSGANPLPAVTREDDGDASTSKALLKIGVICLLVGLPATLLNFYNVISVTQAYGTYSAFTEVDSSGVADDLAVLFVSGIIILCANELVRKSTKKCLLGLSFTVYVSYMILSGSRKTQVFALLAITLNYLFSVQRKKYSVLRFFVAVAVGLFVVNIIYTVGVNRFDLETLPDNIIDSFVGFKFLQTIVSGVLSETGLTLYSVSAVISAVPSVFPYECGLTFVRTALSVLPIGWMVGDFFAKANTTQVINPYFNTPVGASVFGDLYWNFGAILGVIFCFLLGICFTKLYYSLFFDKSHRPFYFIALYVLLIGVRSGVFELYRPFLIAFGVPYIALQIMSRIKKGSSACRRC